ncbi:MAG: prenyltransferase/squalene oxidase repeat-containing protein [Planctomycetota bacterium]|jgi:hypothetical protein
MRARTPLVLLLVSPLLLLALNRTAADEERRADPDVLLKVCERLRHRAEEAADLARGLEARGRSAEAAEVLEDRARLLLVRRSVQKKLDAALAARSEQDCDPGPALPPNEDVRDRTEELGPRVDPELLARNGGSSSTEGAVDLGLAWLALHQSQGGHWDCDGFSAQCRLNRCSGPGNGRYDPGVTGLALLAFLGARETHRSGSHQRTVREGLRYLSRIQSPEGRIGPLTVTKFVYGHAIGTLALVEAYRLTSSPLFKSSAQRAIDYIHRAQNPYLAWRYGVRPGDNDTSVTGWMLAALDAAKRAGLRVDPAGFDGARAWIDKATEPEFGRVGYTARDTGTERPESLALRFPPERSEALTAIGVFSRVRLGEDARKSELIQKGAEILTRRLPSWDEALGTVDMYYWFWGSHATFQVGGDAWKRWNAALKEVLVDRQRKDGDEKGSWDPVGAWGAEGGRVYSTALCVLALEVYYRHPRLFERRLK